MAINKSSTLISSTLELEADLLTSNNSLPAIPYRVAAWKSQQKYRTKEKLSLFLKMTCSLSKGSHVISRIRSVSRKNGGRKDLASLKDLNQTQRLRTGVKPV